MCYNENTKKTVQDVINSMTEEQKKYLKAENDIIEARKSFDELNDVQKEALIKNIIGYETFNSLCNMMKKYFV